MRSCSWGMQPSQSCWHSGAGLPRTGFVGGLNGFLRNPGGHGIGSGGNLSLTWRLSIVALPDVGSHRCRRRKRSGCIALSNGKFGLVLLRRIGLDHGEMWKLYIALHDRLLAWSALAHPTIMVKWHLFKRRPCSRRLHSATVLALVGCCWTCISGTSAPLPIWARIDWTSKGHEQAIHQWEVYNYQRLIASKLLLIGCYRTGPQRGS